MSIRSDLSIRTVALGTSRKNLRMLNQNVHLRRPFIIIITKLVEVLIIVDVWFHLLIIVVCCALEQSFKILIQRGGAQYFGT